MNDEQIRLAAMVVNAYLITNIEVLEDQSEIDKIQQLDEHLQSLVAEMDK